jgi:hypothetical protein
MSDLNHYTQTTYVSGVTALSADTMNNIDAGLTGLQSGGFFKHGTNVSSNTTLESGYNFLVVAPITVDDTIELDIQGNLKVL